MEFVASKKVLKVTIDGVSHELRYPVLFETEALQAQLEKGEAKGMDVYYAFFEKLGLPIAEQKKMDQDDFLDFITFALTPKKKR